MKWMWADGIEANFGAQRAVDSRLSVLNEKWRSYGRV